MRTFSTLFKRKSTFGAFVVALGILAGKTAVAKSDTVEASADSGGPQLNPFECYGRWESATGGRRTAQMRIELQKKQDALAEPGEPASVRAMKYCVVAMLKQRLGDEDASSWFEKAVEAAPEEPGYELFWGMYWANARGANGPVRDQAERHLRAALEKLERLRDVGRFQPFHGTVEDWTQKRLLVLHERDGLALVPYAAYRYPATSRFLPELAFSSQLAVAKDTRDFYHNSEMRTFTGEAAFAASALRSNGTLTKRTLWDLARAPLRLQVENRARLNVAPVGSFDFVHSHLNIERYQVNSFYLCTSEQLAQGTRPCVPLSQNLNDVTVEQFGVSYERVLPLYPFADLRLAGGYRRVKREGLVEFLPQRREDFNTYEFKPSLSRFLGPDKATVGVDYVKMDIASLPGGVPEQAMRQKVIRGIRAEYALYRPLLLPSLGAGPSTRSATRGLYFYAGAVQDDETYGTRQVTHFDYYAGSRLSGPGPWDVTLQGTYYRSRTTYVDPNDRVPTYYTDLTQNFASVRPALAITRRLIDPEALPGLPPRALGFGVDMLNVVVPVHWEFAVRGRNDFENVRGGLEVWAKAYQLGLWGAPLLFTAGYDAQYFYQLDKFMHMFHTNVRLGWGDL